MSVKSRSIEGLWPSHPSPPPLSLTPLPHISPPLPHLSWSIQGFVAVARVRPHKGVDSWVGVCLADNKDKACEVVARSQDRFGCLSAALESGGEKIDGFQMDYMRKQHREGASDSQRKWLRNAKCVEMANAPGLTKYEASVLLGLAFNGHKVRAAARAALKDVPSNDAMRSGGSCE